MGLNVAGIARNPAGISRESDSDSFSRNSQRNDETADRRPSGPPDIMFCQASFNRVLQFVKHRLSLHYS